MKFVYFMQKMLNLCKLYKISDYVELDFNGRYHWK
jgi:hypothetical protein